VDTVVVVPPQIEFAPRVGEGIKHLLAQQARKLQLRLAEKTGACQTAHELSFRLDKKRFASGHVEKASGISHGGRMTKNHALADLLWRHLRLALTPRNTSNINGTALFVRDTARMKPVFADRGCDASRLSATLREQRTIPVIPGCRNRRRPVQYDERRYKDRLRVGAMSCSLKDFRRIASRCDRLARNFFSAVAFWPRMSLDPRGL
jgi:transposase